MSLSDDEIRGVAANRPARQLSSIVSPLLDRSKLLGGS